MTVARNANKAGKFGNTLNLRKYDVETGQGDVSVLPYGVNDTHKHSVDGQDEPTRFHRHSFLVAAEPEDQVASVNRARDRARDADATWDRLSADAMDAAFVAKLHRIMQPSTHRKRNGVPISTHDVLRFKSYDEVVTLSQKANCPELLALVDRVAYLFEFTKDDNMYCQLNYYKDANAKMSPHQDHFWKVGQKMSVVYSVYGE